MPPAAYTRRAPAYSTLAYRRLYGYSNILTYLRRSIEAHKDKRSNYYFIFKYS